MDYVQHTLQPQTYTTAAAAVTFWLRHMIHELLLVFAQWRPWC